MSRATPKLINFAARLLTYEALPGKPAAGDKSAAFRVCEHLRHALTKLTGPAGFKALLNRALMLAIADVPTLSAVKVNADGSLEGLGGVESQAVDDQFVRREAILIAQLLGLLITFVGSNVTSGIIQDIWPQAKFDDLNF